MGGEGGGGSRSSSGGRRGSARRGRRGDGDGNGDGKEGGEGQQHQQRQGQASLSLRNALKMAVYLLFSAAFPAEECYSSAKQVLCCCTYAGYWLCCILPGAPADMLRYSIYLTFCTSTGVSCRVSAGTL